MNTFLNKKLVAIIGCAIAAFFSASVSAIECPSIKTYTAAGSFNAGDIVELESATYQGRYFECIVKDWCNSDSSFYYEPINGLAWEQAWKEVSCNLTDTATDTATDTESHWALVNNDSSVQFVSVKKEHVAEVQFFETVSGSLSETGQLAFAIDLSSINTAIDIRDTRLREYLFEIQILPQLHFSASVDMAAINNMANGDVLMQTISGELDLHAQKKALTTTVTIIKHSDVLQVFSYEAVIISAADFSMDGGVEILRSLAGLSSIGESVPIYFDLSFALNQNTAAPILSLAPVAPSNLALTFDDTSDTVELSWNDNANTETAYVIQKNEDQGFWYTLDSTAMNSEGYSESFDHGVALQYRVFAIAGELSSALTNTAAIDINSYFTGTSTDTATSTDTSTDSSTDTSTDSSTDTATDTDTSTTVTGEDLYRDKGCNSCHGNDGNSTIPIIENIREEMDLALYIDVNMPQGNSADCVGSCALDIANYIVNELYPAPVDGPYLGNRGYRSARLLTPYEYRNAVKTLTAYSVSDSDLPHPHFDSDFKYPTQVETGVILTENARDYFSLAEKIAAATSLSSIACDSATCSDTQIRALGESVFRRPLTEDEFSTYKSFNSSYGSKDLLASMLMSPYFLYRLEIGEFDVEANAYQLNDYEVATAMSFVLFGTTPDATLLNLAANGQLSTVEHINTQADIMLADSRFADHFVEFIRYYSKTYGDAAAKPGLSNEVIAAMKEEQRAAAVYLMDFGAATIDELFNPGYTYVNAALASHYAMASVAGAAVQKVNTDSNRGGVLHQGMTHIMNSDFAATSLVKRGKMIRENMMCRNMGIPIGIDPATINIPTDPLITTRERWNFITGPNASNGQCWECHRLMNDPGSSLESFDAAGVYRTEELAYNESPQMTSLPLVVSGILRDNLGESELTSFSNARTLAQYLSASDTVRDCFVESLYQYNSGFTVDSSTRDNIFEVQRLFQQHGNIKSLSKSLLGIESFLLRIDKLEN
ncbi:MAG: DUF1588 domain-containing protein [Pseudomonadales bacterium]|nr:DUF1588 domain-containing protein [Pseudomonadales bacterium]